MSAMAGERLFSKPETATRLGVSLATLNRIIRKGEIGKYRVGAGRVLFGEHHIADYLKASEEPASIAVEMSEVVG